MGHAWPASQEDRMGRIGSRGIALIVVAASMGACAPPGVSEATGGQSGAIIGGSKANAYEESALIDLSKGGPIVAACSGAVISPHVVLTAGHCIDGFSGWRVRTPYAGGQTVQS